MKPGDVIGDFKVILGCMDMCCRTANTKFGTWAASVACSARRALRERTNNSRRYIKIRKVYLATLIKYQKLVSSSGSEITQKEYADVTSAGLRLVMDVSVLLERLSGSTGDINALWRVVETAGLIGRFMGAHPVQNKIEMKKRRNKRVRWWHSEALVRAAKDARLSRGTNRGKLT